ncbi:MAG: right-handed parallel beta-helix repeat-containing protein [Candidatus Eisenbacteria bacterium]|nr:right-handed parallel beta-helix repeat-containing protein [Candidatus Eisenbacteria bacterium]
MKLRISILTWLASVAGLSSQALARDWYVYVDGSGDAPTIQGAVDQAADGDRIFVGPGTYEERVQVTDTSVHLKSLEGAALTMTQGFSANGDADSVTVTGFGFRSGDNFGVYTQIAGSFAITDCTIEDCPGQTTILSSARIERCTFRGNTGIGGTLGGGGLEVAVHLGEVAEILDCKFIENEAGGVPWGPTGGGGGLAIDATNEGTARVERCLFYRNRAGSAGGMFAVGNVRVDHCTFVQNEAGDGALFMEVDVTEPTGVFNSIFSENEGFAYIAAGFGNCGCNVFWHNDGTIAESCFLPTAEWQHFVAPPQFCDEEAEDFRLSESSTLIGPFGDGHRECQGPIGAYPAGCEVTPLKTTSWGDLKRRFGGSSADSVKVGVRPKTQD